MFETFPKPTCLQDGSFSKISPYKQKQTSGYFLPWLILTMQVLKSGVDSAEPEVFHQKPERTLVPVNATPSLIRPKRLCQSLLSCWTSDPVNPILKKTWLQSTAELTGSQSQTPNSARAPFFSLCSHYARSLYHEILTRIVLAVAKNM